MALFQQDGRADGGASEGSTEGVQRAPYWPCALSHEPNHDMYMAVSSEAPPEPRSFFPVAYST